MTLLDVDYREIETMVADQLAHSNHARLAAAQAEAVGGPMARLLSSPTGRLPSGQPDPGPTHLPFYTLSASPGKQAGSDRTVGR